MMARTHAILRWAVLALTVGALTGGFMVSCGSRGTPSVPLSVADVPISSTAAIWFHPLPPAKDWPGEPGGRGSTDFLDLFQPNAPWQDVSAHTRVLGLYAGWITAVSDQMLQQVVGYIKAHGMGIEIEAPALQATPTCGSGVEGYVPWGQSLHDFTLAYLHRLNALGAPVPYIKVDEPYFFGSVVNDPHSCHWPVTTVAADVGAYAQLVKSVYPNVAIGDVEPIIASAYKPNVVTAIDLWHDTYRRLTGAPFPFFFADIDFSNPAWPSIVRAIEATTRERGMKFGIIYVGDWQDNSDAEWAAKVVARFEIYQGAAGGRPDYVLFQSWQPHPIYCLPSNDPATFTGAMEIYITRLTRS
jgi:hypothetical protein